MFKTYVGLTVVGIIIAVAVTYAIRTTNPPSSPIPPPPERYVPINPTYNFTRVFTEEQYNKQYELEKHFLSNLDSESQTFFKESIKIRSTYPEGNEHKNLPVTWKMDSRGYAYVYGSDYGKTLPQGANVFYRYKKDCESDTTILRMIVDKAAYPRNIGGTSSMKDTQCYADGSFDTYNVDSDTSLE